MMFPPVFTLLNVPSITTFVGNAPSRIFDYGVAPQDTVRPYIVFQQVSNTRYDNISDKPCGDADSVQVDCYSDSRDQARSMARAVREVFDAQGLSNRLTLQIYEPETKLYRISTDVDFIQV